MKHARNHESGYCFREGRDTRANSGPPSFRSCIASRVFWPDSPARCACRHWSSDRPASLASSHHRGAAHRRPRCPKLPASWGCRPAPRRNPKAPPQAPKAQMARSRPAMRRSMLDQTKAPVVAMSTDRHKRHCRALATRHGRDAVDLPPDRPARVIAARPSRVLQCSLPGPRCVRR